ncbi:MAG TPA: hypothetical protein VNZ22_08690 [Bacillota bacterium]|nr:hypothetical protein [Bacillota bacterium]
MRVFLRHARIGHYYRGNYEWVVEAADARDFGSIEEALQIAADDKLDNINLVIRYDDSGREQVFSLSEEVPAPKPRARETD